MITITTEIATIIRTITDFLLCINIIGFCLIYKQQGTRIKLLETLVRLQEDTDVVKAKVNAIKQFDEFLDYLHESGRINLEEREDREWREKFIKSLESQ